MFRTTLVRPWPSCGRVCLDRVHLDQQGSSCGRGAARTACPVWASSAAMLDRCSGATERSMDDVGDVVAAAGPWENGKTRAWLSG